MINTLVPKWVKKIITGKKQNAVIDNSAVSQVMSDIEVSVVIPALNEENNIGKTLLSLSSQKTKHRFEVIVVDNNSFDKTKEVAETNGAIVISEPVQGISFARQRGLLYAKGKYILNADADTIYPEKWIERMINSLVDENTSCVYGAYSLIPPKGNSRIGLAFYEIISSLLFTLRKKHRAYLNVMGFNFGFKKVDAIKVGGFNLKRKIWSDGWMAMLLMDLGSVKAVKNTDAKVWTSSRRLLADGSLFKAFKRRIKKEVSRLKEYIVNVPIKKDESYI
jgi:glycosyltransferase involved in cell wall biosynthesis